MNQISGAEFSSLYRIYFSINTRINIRKAIERPSHLKSCHIPQHFIACLINGKSNPERFIVMSAKYPVRNCTNACMNVCGVCRICDYLPLSMNA